MGNLIGGKDDKMSYKFKITRGNAILNFSEEYCQSRCELIESESFARVLKGYVHDIKRKKTTAYEYLREVQKESIDTNLLVRISILLGKDFFSDLSDYVKEKEQLHDSR